VVKADDGCKTSINHGVVLVGYYDVEGQEEDEEEDECEDGGETQWTKWFQYNPC